MQPSAKTDLEQDDESESNTEQLIIELRLVAFFIAEIFVSARRQRNQGRSKEFHLGGGRYKF